MIAIPPADDCGSLQLAAELLVWLCITLLFWRVDWMLTDAQWTVLEPLIEACRPSAKVPPQHLRRTISAIVWRHDNGAKWRSVPPELGPWWMAAQTFIRWSRLGVWKRLLTLVQEQGVQLGMTFLDGTSIRAHQKAAGAAKKVVLQRNGTIVKRLAGLAAAMAPRLA